MKPPLFYTYQHTRNDTGAIFYIGKGHGSRLTSRKSRNAHWHNIVAKHGYTATIIASFASSEEALTHEVAMIALHSKTCSLVNQTAGGDGLINPSDETRAKMRAKKLGCANATGERSKEAKERMRIAQLGNSNAKGNKSISGQQRTVETRAKIAETVRISWIARRAKRNQQIEAII